MNLVRNCCLTVVGLIMLGGCPSDTTTVTPVNTVTPDVQKVMDEVPAEEWACSFVDDHAGNETSYSRDPATGTESLCGRLDQGFVCDSQRTLDGGSYYGKCIYSRELAEQAMLGLAKMREDDQKADDFSSSELITVAIGQCAPPWLVICGDVLGDTLDGEPLNGKVMCYPHKVGDIWVTQRIPVPCQDGTMCEMSGSGLNLAECNPVTECDASTPCPDTGNPCTANTCSEQGYCEEGFLDGNACNDGNACTESDMCAGGACVGSTLNCDDDNDCTEDWCDPTEGCQNGAVSAGSECRDGDICTTGEACDGAGVCVAADLNKCDDDDACNGVYSCDLTTGACTLEADPVTCDDGNICTDDMCNPATGECEVVNNTNLCDDDDLCTWFDTCADGACAGTSVDYNDGDLCNGMETCDTTTGLPVVGTPLVNDEDPDDLCTEDICEPSTGTFTHNAYMDGTACDPTNDAFVCIDGSCTSDWCNADSMVGCSFWPDADGVLMASMLTCDIPVGESYGSWVETVCPGPMTPFGTWTCADNYGCVDLAGTGVEANNCADGIDNDGDGAMDCLDDDCFSDPACPGSCSDDSECDTGEVCDLGGVCCAPDCSGKQCGDDGCGGSCGACDIGQICNASDLCVSSCVPDCSGGKQCGDDGCGGSCGTCTDPEVCNTTAGTCEASCTPDCTDKVCGDDGCGGSCGTCTSPDTCDASGTCVAPTPTGVLDVTYTVDVALIPSGLDSISLLVECMDASNFAVVPWNTKDSLSSALFPASGSVTLSFNVTADLHHCNKVNVAGISGATAVWWAARYNGFALVEDGDVAYSYDDGTTTWTVTPTVGTKPNVPGLDSSGENWWFAPGTDTDGDGIGDGVDTCPLDPTCP